MSFSATIKSEPPDRGYESAEAAMTVVPVDQVGGIPRIKTEPETLLPFAGSQAPWPSLEQYQARYLTENVPLSKSKQTKTYSNTTTLTTRKRILEPDSSATALAKKKSHEVDPQQCTPKNVHKHTAPASKTAFKCSFCGFDSAGWEEAYLHAAGCAARKEKEGTTGPFPCKTCDSKFKEWEELVQHASNCMSSKAFTCIFCSKTVIGAEELRKHTEVCSKSPNVSQPSTSKEPTIRSQYTCQICKLTFRREDHLKEHTKHCIPLKLARSQFPCTYCKLTFGKEEHLRQHTRFCTKVRKLFPLGSFSGQKANSRRGLACSYCNSSFDTWDAMLEHSQTCEVKLCAEEGRKQAEKAKSAKRKKAVDPIVFPCHICHAKFDTWNGKLKHMPICKSKKKVLFKCSYCGTFIEKEDALKKHVFNCAAKHGVKLSVPSQASEVETQNGKVNDSMRETETQKKGKAGRKDESPVTNKRGEKLTSGPSKEKNDKKATLDTPHVARKSAVTAKASQPDSKTTAPTGNIATSKGQRKDPEVEVDVIVRMTGNFTKKEALSGLKAQEMHLETSSLKTRTRKIEYVGSPDKKDQITPSLENVNATPSISKLSLKRKQVDIESSSTEESSKKRKKTSTSTKEKESDTTGNVNQMQPVVLVPKIPLSYKGVQEEDSGNEGTPAIKKKEIQIPKGGQKKENDSECGTEKSVTNHAENEIPRQGRSTSKRRTAKVCSPQSLALKQKTDKKGSRNKPNSCRSTDSKVTNPDTSTRSEDERTNDFQVDHLQALDLMPTNLRRRQSRKSLLKNKDASEEESDLEKSVNETPASKAKEESRTSKKEVTDSIAGRVRNKTSQRKRINIQNSSLKVFEKDKVKKSPVFHKRSDTHLQTVYHKIFHEKHYRHKHSRSNLPRKSYPVNFSPPLKGSFGCHFCNARFNVWDDVEKHVRLCKRGLEKSIKNQTEHRIGRGPSVGPSESLKLGCKFCGKKFDEWNSVQEHVKTCVARDPGKTTYVTHVRKFHKSTTVQSSPQPVLQKVAKGGQLLSGKQSMTMGTPDEQQRGSVSHSGNEEHVAIKREPLDAAGYYGDMAMQYLENYSILDFPDLPQEHSTPTTSVAPDQTGEVVFPGYTITELDQPGTSTKTEEASGLHIEGERHISEQEFSSLSADSEAESVQNTNTGTIQKNQETNQVDAGVSTQVKEEPKDAIGSFECAFCHSRILCVSWDDVKKHTTECMPQK
ncbi:uncharacterized protein LOC106170751 [Lingula anatina]|uniref:Uncharacterized protein LOC106170751 n=1 Tax=Lingula anatina TaxID=7574 RepID=A0A1S3J7H7_LINAN|nr:uncharacterized protein LOC106170751 [Lingula anatina]|eukprot:XP_013406191.1 uncharacterized protein LOC106170751 [Lingula anatina]